MGLVVAETRGGLLGRGSHGVGRGGVADGASRCRGARVAWEGAVVGEGMGDVVGREGRGVGLGEQVGAEGAAGRDPGGVVVWGGAGFAEGRVGFPREVGGVRAGGQGEAVWVVAG